MCSCRDFGIVNAPPLSASARSSGRIDKRWQSFLNCQLSIGRLWRLMSETVNPMSMRHTLPTEGSMTKQLQDKIAVVTGGCLS